MISSMSDPGLLSRVSEVRRAFAIKRRADALVRGGPEAVAAHQRLAFRAVLGVALERSSFYRDFYGPGAQRAALAELPVLTKDILMENFDAAVTDRRLRLEDLRAHIDRDEDLHLGEFRAMSSGGSSRVRGVFVFDRDGWSHVTAASLRASEIVGFRPRLPRRMRNAFVYAPGGAHMSARSTRSMDVGIHRTLRLDVTLPLDELVSALNRFSPDALISYPSMLALLAQELRDGRLWARPWILTASSEPMSPAVRQQIRDAFGVQPHDLYAMTETGPMAIDCAQHAGKHVFEDQAIVEVVDDDGRPVAPGETGARILVTNLFNRVQPLIRLEVTDRLQIAEEPCACGWPLRTIAAVEGRADDVLQLPGRNGDTVALVPLHFGALTALAGVREFDVVHDPGVLRVRIVPTPGGDSDATIAAVEAELVRMLDNLAVASGLLRVERCTELPRDQYSGKRRIVRSNVAHATTSPSR
jgi:phenylacetate-CoA ligase